MPLPLDSERGRRRFVVAGTVHFERLLGADLDNVPHELAQLVAVLSGMGYEGPPSAIDLERDELRTLFASTKANCRDGDTVVAYYSGHGVRDQERFYLLARNSDEADLDETALSSEDLVRALTKGSKADQVMIILDTCYAGAGAAEAAVLASRLSVGLSGSGPGIFVVAAARSRQEASEGALAAALEAALANRQQRLAGRTQAHLAIDDVMGAVDDYLRVHHPQQAATWSSINVQGRCRLFPNPYYRPDMRPGLDLETQRAFDEHWLPKARGAEVGAGGWYFTGRDQAMRELTQWLQREDSGGRALVVTGGPGCGKSAVLSRVVTLSNPRYRGEVLAGAGGTALDPATLPAEHAVDVAVHVRRKLLAEVVAQVAQALGLNVESAADLTDALAQRAERTVVVFDALDEADETEKIVSQLLRPLVALRNVLILVAVRPDTSERGRRFRALGASSIEIDLDDPKYVGADDVALYVERRLLASEEPGRVTPYRAVRDVARLVAQAVSVRAQNVFLVAHTASFALLARQDVVDINENDWVGRLPSGLDDAFSQFLAEFDARGSIGLSSVTVRAVLMPLAFAEGEGLPWVNLWAPIAAAIAGQPISDAQIELTRKHAAAFIVEAVEDERSVYRLYHEALAEHLRGPPEAQVPTHKRIVEALRSVVCGPNEAKGSPPWERANPYVLTHLPAHALKAGLMAELAVDGRLLAASEPVRTTQALARAGDSSSRRAFAAYVLAHSHVHVRSSDSLSYLEMAARQLGDDELAATWTREAPDRAWSVPWAHWTVSPHRVLTGSGGQARVFAVGKAGEQAVVVAGCEDGAIRIWDLASGELRDQPLLGHGIRVTAVQIGEVGGRMTIASGAFDGAIRLWDLSTGESIGQSILGHDGHVTGVAIGELDGQTFVISSAFDGVVRWCLSPAGHLIRTVMWHDHARANVMATGALGSKPIIATASDDRRVRFLEFEGGKQCHDPLASALPVTALALAVLDGQTAVASATGDQVQVSFLDGDRAPLPPLRAEGGAQARSLALGLVNGLPVLASGWRDGAVRLWDVTAGVTIGEALRGHESNVVGIALATHSGRPLVVSCDSNGTIRVWEQPFDGANGKPKDGHEGPVLSIAAARPDGLPMLATAGSDGTVHFWDMESGSARGSAIRSHNGAVTAVEFAELSGESILVTGGLFKLEGKREWWWEPRLSIRRWNANTHEVIGLESLGIWTRATDQFLQRPFDSLRSLATGLLDGRSVVVAGGTLVRVLDLASGEVSSKPMSVPAGQVGEIAMLPLAGRTHIVSAGVDGIVRTWDPAIGATTARTTHRHGCPVTALATAIIEGQAMALTGGKDGTLRLWDLEKGTPYGPAIPSHSGMVSTVVLGTLAGEPAFVSGGTDGTVRIWRYPDPGCRSTICIGSSVNRIVVADDIIALACDAGVMALQVS